MTDEEREKYLEVVNIICEQFGLNKPNQIIYVCEAVENLIESYKKENAELKAQSERTEVYLAKIFENGWMSDFLVFGTLEKAESFKKEHEKSTPIDIRIKIEQYLVR